MVNDIADHASDSLHPEKSKRPIASGRITVSSALILSALFFAIGNGLAFFLSSEFGFCALSYCILTGVYSLLLKKKVLIDVISISIGFVIRAIAGAVVIEVYISPWLILCAFMLAMFLALSKRKREESPLYGPQVLDFFLSVTTALVIMSYSLYTFLRASQEMMVTIPLVLYGLFRFLQLSFEKGSARTELFFSDRGLVATLILWVFLVIVIIYVFE